MREQVNFQWDDDEVRFVLDKHVWLDCCSATILTHYPDSEPIEPTIYRTRDEHAITITSPFHVCWKLTKQNKIQFHTGTP